MDCCWRVDGLASVVGWELEDLIVFPGKAWAAIAVKTPVNVTLAATIQRLASTSLRSPASLACTVSFGAIYRGLTSERKPS